MWKVILVEDEQPILDLEKRLLEREGLFDVIAMYTAPKQALLELEGVNVDAIILDIEMPKMTGLELASQLVERGIDVPIIFSTAYSKYAIDAFRVQALDYILKPMTPNIVKQVDERLAKYYGRAGGKLETGKLEVQLYGDTHVRQNGTAIKWPTKITEELFYYLLIRENTVVSKYRIIDDLWPNHDDKRATANLYNTIYRMRQLFTELGVPIQIDRVNNGYELKTGSAIQLQPSKNPEDTLLETKGYLWSYTILTPR
ncbi:MAG: response regulator [Lysinibacillus sp.]